MQRSATIQSEVSEQTRFSKDPSQRQTKMSVCVCQRLTVFVTGDGDIVDSTQFKAGAGEDLKL